MGYKGVVKDNVIVLEQGWWMSEEAKRNATDKKAFKELLDECNELRKQMPKTTDSVQIIRGIREKRSCR